MIRREKRVMKKSTLTLAVMAGALGLPLTAEQASAAPAFVDDVMGSSFFKDSKATLGLRNFYVNEDTRHAGPRGAQTASDWGQGFALKYQSGFTEGPVGFGVDALGLWAVRLSGGGNGTGGDHRPASFPSDSGLNGGNNGEPVREFGSFGLTGKMRISKTIGEYGTLTPNLPVIQTTDSRVLTQTFNGGQITSKEIDNLTLVGGRIDHTKNRGSSDMTGFGVSGSYTSRQDSNQFYYAGGDYKVNKDLLVQYYFANMKDYYNQHFAGLVHNWGLPVGKLTTDLRFFHSTSDGNNSHAASSSSNPRNNDNYVVRGYYGNGNQFGKVDNDAYSAMFTYSLKGHALSAGYQVLTGKSDFPFLQAGDGDTAYLITNALVGRFQHAGERTWLAQYAYDFANIGLPGLRASAIYLQGNGIDSARGNLKQHETNVRLDYVIQSGMLKGLGFTYRGGILRGQNIPGDADRDHNRLIVSYSIPLL